MSNPAGERPSESEPLVVEALFAPSEDDVRELATLLTSLSSATPPDHAGLAEIVSAPGTTLLVARSAGHIVGALTLVVFRIPTGIRALVEDVVVDVSLRRRGIGAALVSEALRIAERCGARTVDLTSRPSREAANRLYERAGFARRETNVYRFSLETATNPPGRQAG